MDKDARIKELEEELHHTRNVESETIKLRERIEGMLGLRGELQAKVRLNREEHDRLWAAIQKIAEVAGFEFDELNEDDQDELARFVDYVCFRIKVGTNFVETT